MTENEGIDYGIDYGTYGPPATRVANGAALLDEQRPGWAKQIFRERLDLSDTCHCVIGQLFDQGDEYPGRYAYGEGTRALGVLSIEAQVEYGFEQIQAAEDIENRGSEYEELTRLWLLEIEQRLTGEEV